MLFLPISKKVIPPKNLWKWRCSKVELRRSEKEVIKRADLSDFYVKGKGKVTVTIKFTINEKGEMENVALQESSGLKEYDEMLISSVTSIKKKWNPAKIYGYPIRYQFRLPISFVKN